jgi:hypothetical protein
MAINTEDHKIRNISHARLSKASVYQSNYRENFKACNRLLSLLLDLVSLSEGGPKRGELKVERTKELLKKGSN